MDYRRLEWVDELSPQVFGKAHQQRFINQKTFRAVQKTVPTSRDGLESSFHPNIRCEPREQHPRRAEIFGIPCATGGFGAQELRDVGAEWIYDDLPELIAKLDETPLGEA